MGPSHTIKAGLLGLLGAIAFFGNSGEAKAYANDYCREYTRTVYIGGRTENAYGKACLQPNGDWMIVDEDLGYNDIPDNVSNVNYVIRDYNRTYVPERVVYYGRPQTVNVYRSAPAPVYYWNQKGHYHKGRHVVYKNTPPKHVHYNRYKNDRRDHAYHNRDRHRGHRGRD